MKPITKVVKIELNWIFTPEGTRAYPYDDLFEIQRQVSLVKNKTVQLCWEWNNFGVDFHAMTGAYANAKEVTGKTLETYIYNLLGEEFGIMYSLNRNASVRNTVSDFQNAIKEIRRGERSILSYRKDKIAKEKEDIEEWKRTH